MDTDRKVLLIVEARTADANLILKMLREADRKRIFMVEVVDTLMDGIKRVDDADVALIDLSLPDSDGLASFRAMHNTSSMPIIVLTDSVNEQVGLQAIKEGAQDFLVFGQFTPQTLHRSIMYSIERHRRELAESRLGTVLTAMVTMRKEVNGLICEVRNCRRAVSSLNSKDCCN